MQSGNAFASNVATSELASSLRLDIDNLEIKDSECLSRVTFIHINFPREEILQATLAKYRKKPIILEMVNAALDFYATYEESEKTLFYSDKNSARTMLKSERHTKIIISKC